MSAGFAELHAVSNFSFLRGASHPQELVAEAAGLGYAALAITDECSLAGAVRAHLEAKRLGFKLIIGSEFRLQDGPKLVLLATNRSGYGQLVALITLARRAAEKGEYRLLRHQLETQALDHCLAIWLPDAEPDIESGAWLKRRFPTRCWIGVELFLEGTDGQRLAALQALGLLKVDVLSLGMLTAIRKALAHVSESLGRPFTMADIPPEDPEVYAMLQRADSIGVFQVESRAQMTMLPRLKPKNYYDLVIQIAIVRPGPIQGDMVHPYLARRAGREPVSYPSPAVKKVLERTLGVPIFQEQVMQLAMVAAGFTAGEADELRRAMAAWHRKGGLEPFEKRLLDGMRERGYEERFARQIYRQIQGFGEYGFPESHSASFALLAYVSAWLKCHHPAAFACALLNSQPMGFYGPSQLIQDARRHGVGVCPIDVRHSAHDCTLEPPDASRPALRLGLRLVKGLSVAAAERLVEARRSGPFGSVQDLACRARLDRRDLEALAAADALRGLAGHRHRAFWEAAGVETPTPLHAELEFAEAAPLLRRPDEAAEVIADYATAGATLRRHPLSLLRERLNRRGFRTAEALWRMRNGAVARVAGLVVCRQRPMTAGGTTFVTIEDETGQVNLIVWPSTARAQRRPLLRASLLAVTGTVQHEEGVLHLVAGRLQDLGHWLQGLVAAARDFR
ncbi:MAG TPA: PHP domain-containing protein [Methylococcus sp.]|nr:PHP domain-containing protein [Methylococcus sp.]